MYRFAAIALLIATVMAASGCSGGSGSGSRIGPPPGTGGSSGGSSSSSPGPAGVSIYPTTETLRIGGQRRFSGWDSTVGQYDVTWSLQEGSAAGTITADGLYTAPSTPGIFHLIATSVHNTSLSA